MQCANVPLNACATNNNRTKTQIDKLNGGNEGGMLGLLVYLSPVYSENEVRVWLLGVQK